MVAKQESLRINDKLVDEFPAADIYMVGVPMCN